MTEPKPEYEVPQSKKRKRGRPKNGEYPVKATVRFTEEQADYIGRVAKYHNVTFVEAVRLCVVFHESELDYRYKNADRAT